MFLLFILTLLSSAFAFAGPSRTTYQAKIIKPDGYPLEAASVNFSFTILDPSGTCQLYTEKYNGVSMASTGGLISFSLGTGVKTFPVSATTFEQVFSNITPFLACASGGPANYSPNANDTRKILMQFNDGSGWQTLPAMSINAVPYAMYANDASKLNGMEASEFVQVSTLQTCTASEAIHYNGSSFSCIAVGASGAVSSGSVITALGYTPADGASVTAVTSTVDSVSSTVAAVSSTVFLVSSTVTSLQNSVVASFAAVTSSQWVSSGTTINYTTGNVGVGTVNPNYLLHVRTPVSGATRVGFEAYGSTPGLYFLRANGTTAAPQPVSSSQALLEIAAVGYGQTNYLNASAAKILMSAEDNWSDVTGAASIRFHTRGTSTTAASLERMRIAHTGFVGIGTSSPVTTLDVSGGIRVGTENNSCVSALAGTLRYNAGVVEYCNGTLWAAFGVSGAGILAINGLASGSQTFAFAADGTTPSVSSVGSVHTFNFPYAASASVVGGLLSNADYVAFNNKVGAASFTALSTTTANLSTSITAVNTMAINLSTSMTNLSASVGAIVSSQWVTSGTSLYNIGSNIGLGTVAPSGRLELQSVVSNTMMYHLNSSLHHSTVTSGSFNVVGLHTWVRPGVSTGATNTATVYGVANRIVRNATAGIDDNGTQTALFGEHISFGHSNVGGASPTTLSMTGLYIDSQLGAGTVNNYTALRLANPSTSGAIVTNRWGFAQDDLIANNYFLGNLGLGTTTPSARLQIAAGSVTRAPLRMTAGTLLASAQSGTIEYDGSTYYVTDDLGVRRAISTGLVSGSIDNASTINSTGNITMVPVGSVVVSNTTASTDPTTGALVVKGGVGIYGDTNISGTVTATNAIMGLSTGMVGIGVSIPTTKLDVRSEGSIKVAHIQYSGTGFGTQPNLEMFRSRGTINAPTAVLANDVLGSISALGYNGTSFGVGSTGGILFKAAQNFSTTEQGTYIAFATTASSTITQSEKMRLDASGNLGIGTTSPQAKLDVSGAIRVSQNTGTFFYMRETATSGTPTYDGVRFAYEEDLFGTNYDGLVFEKTDLNGSIPDGGFMFASRGTSNTRTVGLSIRTNGIALGMFSPGNARLGIASGTATLAPVKFTSGTLTTATQSGTMEYDGYNYYLTDEAGIRRTVLATTSTASGHILLAASGIYYVGVGVASSPLGPLHVNAGGIAGLGLEDDDDGIVIQNYQPTLTFRDSSVGDADDLRLRMNSSYLFFETSPDFFASSPVTTTLMTLTASGRLGIGRTPGSLLQIATPVSGGVNNRLVSGHSNSDLIDVTGLSGESYLDHIVSARYSATASTTLTKVATFKIDQAPTASGALTITDPLALWVEAGNSSFGGNIGIGTTSATAALTIVKSTANGSQISLTGTSANGYITVPNVGEGIIMSSSRYNGSDWVSDSTGAAALTVSDGIIQMFTNNGLTAGASHTYTERARMDNAGNFIIGGATAYGNLTVQSSGSTYIDLNSTNGTHKRTGMRFRSNGTSQFEIGIDGQVNGTRDFYIYDSVSTTQRVAINSVGYVGINNGSPTRLLHVGNAGIGTGTPVANFQNADGICTITPAAAGSGIACSSDERLKENFVDVGGILALAKVLKFQAVSYNFKTASNDNRHTGYRAQEVQKILPELVRQDERGYLQVYYDGLIPFITEAIKEVYTKLLGIDAQVKTQAREIASVKAENADMKAELNKLKTQNEVLKAYLCEKDPTAPICK